MKNLIIFLYCIYSCAKEEKDAPVIHFPFVQLSSDTFCITFNFILTLLPLSLELAKELLKPKRVRIAMEEVILEDESKPKKKKKKKGGKK